MKRQLMLAVVALFAASIGWAQDRPDFSGEWVLNLAKSTLATTDVASGVVHIDHKEPRFAFRRTFAGTGGPSEASYQLTTDGRELTATEGDRVRRSRMYWEGQELVLDETIEMSGRTATNVVHYRLENGGKVLVAHEVFTAPRFKHDNLWIFDRK